VKSLSDWTEAVVEHGHGMLLARSRPVFGVGSTVGGSVGENFAPFGSRLSRRVCPSTAAQSLQLLKLDSDVIDFLGLIEQAENRRRGVQPFEAFPDAPVAPRRRERLDKTLDKGM